MSASIDRVVGPDAVGQQVRRGVRERDAGVLGLHPVDRCGRGSSRRRRGTARRRPPGSTGTGRRRRCTRRAPGRRAGRAVTAVPVATTVPTASCPSTRPSGTSGTSPLRMCRSVPQMVTASTRMIASVGSTISGSGRRLPVLLASSVIDERAHRNLLVATEGGSPLRSPDRPRHGRGEGPGCGRATRCSATVTALHQGPTAPRAECLPGSVHCRPVPERDRKARAGGTFGSGASGRGRGRL